VIRFNHTGRELRLAAQIPTGHRGATSSKGRRPVTLRGRPSPTLHPEIVIPEGYSFEDLERDFARIPPNPNRATDWQVPRRWRSSGQRKRQSNVTGHSSLGEVEEYDIRKEPRSSGRTAKVGSGKLVRPLKTTRAKARARKMSHARGTFIKVNKPGRSMPKSARKDALIADSRRRAIQKGAAHVPKWKRRLNNLTGFSRHPYQNRRSRRTWYTDNQLRDMYSKGKTLPALTRETIYSLLDKRKDADLIRALLLRAGIEPNPGPSGKKGMRVPRSKQPKLRAVRRQKPDDKVHVSSTCSLACDGLVDLSAIRFVKHSQGTLACCQCGAECEVIVDPHDWVSFGHPVDRLPWSQKFDHGRALVFKDVRDGIASAFQGTSLADRKGNPVVGPFHAIPGIFMAMAPEVAEEMQQELERAVARLPKGTPLPKHVAELLPSTPQTDVPSTSGTTPANDGPNDEAPKSAITHGEPLSPSVKSTPMTPVVGDWASRLKPVPIPDPPPAPAPSVNPVLQGARRQLKPAQTRPPVAIQSLLGEPLPKFVPNTTAVLPVPVVAPPGPAPMMNALIGPQPEHPDDRKEREKREKINSPLDGVHASKKELRKFAAEHGLPHEDIKITVTRHGNERDRRPLMQRVVDRLEADVIVVDVRFRGYYSVTRAFFMSIAATACLFAALFGLSFVTWPDAHLNITTSMLHEEHLNTFYPSIPHLTTWDAVNVDGLFWVTQGFWVHPVWCLLGFLCMLLCFVPLEEQNIRYCPHMITCALSEGPAGGDGVATYRQRMLRLAQIDIEDVIYLQLQHTSAMLACTLAKERGFGVGRARLVRASTRLLPP